MAGVLFIYFIFISSAFIIAFHAQNSFERYVGLGLASLLAIPALINICVVTGLLPAKGLSLPFISFGGSNLLINIIAVAIVLKIVNQNKKAKNARRIIG